MPTEAIARLDIPAGSYCERFINDSSTYDMDYWLFVPENATENMPLIVFLHGIGEVGRVDAIEDYGPITMAREIYGEDFPFILLYPNTKMESWWTEPIPSTLKELIDHIAEQCSVDRERIILTGHSLGSIGTWCMLSRYGDFFSAAVPVSCGCDEPMNYENCAKVPIWAFVGAADEFEPKYENGMRRIIQGILDAGGQAELTVLDGHNHEDTKTTAYTKETFEWMLSQ